MWEFKFLGFVTPQAWPFQGCVLLEEALASLPHLKTRCSCMLEVSQGMGIVEGYG